MDVRATFVMDAQTLKLMRALSKYKRVSQKELLQMALDSFFGAKKSEMKKAIKLCGDLELPPETSNVVAIKKKDETALNARRATWSSYATAYKSRVGQTPLQNSKNNSLIKQFVDRIGHEESPHVIRFFVLHPEGRYVSRLYMLDLAVKDAESLRAQWANQNAFTSKDIERLEARHDMANQRQRILQGEL